MSEEQKKAWTSTMTLKLMSSEESQSDSDEAVFVIRPLPWRNSKINSFFESRDKNSKYAGKRSIKMSFSRSVGDPSDRPKPGGLPDWVFKTTSK